MPENKTRIPRNVIVVALVAMTSGFGQDLITPVLPAYLAAIGVSRGGIGLIDGLLSGSASLFRFVSGILSDRFRTRKFFIFLGYAFSSLARPFLALAGSFVPVAALRTIDGIGKGMKDAPRDALVADSASAEIRGRAFGFHRFIDTAGSVLGPIAAGSILLLLTPSLRAYKIIFAMAAIPGAVALALIALGIKEPKKTSVGTKIENKKLSWRFWLFTLGMTVAMLTKINDSLFLLRANEIGIPLAWIPFLFAGFTFAYAALSYPIGIWSDKIGKLPLITFGWLLLALVELGFANNPNISFALALFAFYGLFYALTEGSSRAFIADLVPPEARGSAYAIFHTLVGLSVIAGGYVLGLVWDLISAETAFRLASAGSFFGFLILLATLAAGKIKLGKNSQNS